jgi:hypothetical protein
MPITGTVINRGKMWLRIKRLRSVQNIDSHIQFVTHASHGQDEAWMIRITLNFFAQPANMNVHHLWLALIFSTPDVRE